MKNYYKNGIAPKESGFITGYKKSFDVDKYGNIYDTIEIYTADGECEVFKYTSLLEINTLRRMRSQFSCIDKDRMKGKYLKEYNKVQFFLEHEDEINRALMNKAKKNVSIFNKDAKDGRVDSEGEDIEFISSKFISYKTMETAQRLKGLERNFAISVGHNAPEHMRVVKNVELAERLGISLEELELIKSKNPNPGMRDHSLLVSVDRLATEDILLGLGNEGFDLYSISKKDLVGLLTGEISNEEALSKGMKLITEEEFAKSLDISKKELGYLRNLQNDERLLEVPLVTMNDLDNYSIEDLKAILDGQYEENYIESVGEEKVESRKRRFSLRPLCERVCNFNIGRRPKFY